MSGSRQAGVGIGAIYSRYPGNEELLRTLCHRGLSRFVAETEAARADDGDAWAVFTDYVARIVDADTSSLTLALAGTFTHDLSLVWQLIAAIKTPDPERRKELRRRYLAVILHGLRTGDATPLPGPPPSWTEISNQWRAGSTQEGSGR
jgi:AcrR family transcriptional regulator